MPFNDFFKTLLFRTKFATIHGICWDHSRIYRVQKIVNNVLLLFRSRSLETAVSTNIQVELIWIPFIICIGRICLNWITVRDDWHAWTCWWQLFTSYIYIEWFPGRNVPDIKRSRGPERSITVRTVQLDMIQKDSASLTRKVADTLNINHWTLKEILTTFNALKHYYLMIFPHMLHYANRFSKN